DHPDPAWGIKIQVQPAVFTKPRAGAGSALGARRADRACGGHGRPFVFGWRLMRRAPSVVLATVLGTLAVLVVSGYLRTRREVALFDSDIRNDHALIGTTLAVCVASTWSSAGEEQALGLVEQANAARDYLTIRWVHGED